MNRTKRITISFSDKDIDLINFINRQQNASLFIRLICKKWIAEHGTGDVVDILTTQSDTDKSEPPSSFDLQKQNQESKNDDTQKLLKTDSDLNDANFYEL